MDYKVGDKVKIIANKTSHGFDLGDEVEIIELFPDGTPPHYEAEGDSCYSWRVKPCDIEII